MLQAMVVILLILMSLAGCMSEYEICIDKQRSEFRQRNPNASHALMNSRQQEFEMMCSSLRNK